MRTIARYFYLAIRLICLAFTVIFLLLIPLLTAIWMGRQFPTAQMAYVEWDRANTSSEIRLLDLAHRLSTTLFGAFGQIDTPSWSPDGSTLYFATFRSERIGRDIAAVNLPTRAFRWLTDGPYDNNTPDVSPNGQAILFASDTRSASQWDIFLLDLVSGKVRPIFEGGGIDGQPSWSPDGEQLSFDTSFSGYTESFATLYVQDVAGGDVQRVVGSNSFTGDWSPDGRQIAFVSSRDGSYDIYRVNADGTNLHRLTEHPSGDFSPAWSSDGSQIAFVSRRTADGEAHIYLMQADGSATHLVTTGRFSTFYPAWRP